MPASSVRRHGTDHLQRAGSRPRFGHRRRQGRQAQAVPDRLLLHGRRQEVRDGDHRHHRDRLRDRPHDRQPQDVPRGDRPTNGERVYDIDIYGEFLRELLVPILPRTLLPVDPATRADRRRAAARPRRLLADAPEPQGPPGEVPVGARLPGRQLRQPHDALDRHHRRAVPRSGTSPTSPGAGSTPTSSAARCTTTSTPA